MLSTKVLFFPNKKVKRHKEEIMALSGSSLEQRRWLVVGIALHHVLTPCLRDKIKAEMTPFYQHLVRCFGLDKQTYPTVMKNIPPSTVNLTYESINSNHTATHRSLYDYCVKDEVSLAKLFMKPFMAHFSAFDCSFDSSAALAVLCGALPFVSVKAIAEDVRSKVRNEWAHCEFTAWTEAHYETCFDLMESLVKNLGFLNSEEEKILGDLKLWKNHGTFCIVLEIRASQKLAKPGGRGPKNVRDGREGEREEGREGEK